MFSPLSLLFFAGLPWRHDTFHPSRAQLQAVQDLASVISRTALHGPFRALLPPYTSACSLAAHLATTFKAKKISSAINMGHSGAITARPASREQDTQLGYVLTPEAYMFDASTLTKTQRVNPVAVGSQPLLIPLVKAAQMSYRDKPAIVPTPSNLITVSDRLPQRSPLLFVDTTLPETRVNKSVMNTQEARIVVHLCASLLGVLPGTYGE
jgi:hypothetical protein